MSAKRTASLVLVGAAFGAALTAALFAVLDRSDEDTGAEADAGADQGPIDDLGDSTAGDREPRARDRDLTGDCVLAGTVSKPDGEPVAEALVGVRLLDEPWLTADIDLQVRTDEAGRYKIKGLTESARFQLWAWAPGFATASYEDAQCGAMTDLALEPGASLSIEVTDAERDPVGPVRLVIAGSELWPPRSATSGPDGALTIEGLAPGVYQVWGETGGRGQLTQEPIEVAPPEQRRVDLDLVAAKPATVAVVDARSGKPIRGASVLYGPTATSMIYRGAPTDGQGRAILTGLPPGEHSASAIAPGYEASETRPLRPGDEIAFRLQRGGTVSGSVLGPDDAPIAEAQITVDQDLGSAAVSLHGGSQRRFLERMVGAADQGWPELHALDEGTAIPGPANLPLPSTGSGGSAWGPSDAEGRFRIDGLPGGRILLGASHPLFVLDGETAVTLESGTTVAGVVIRMKPGCAASVRTLDERGYPIRGAEVAAYDTAGEVLRRSLTGTDGFVELAGLPARFEIVATAEGRVPAAARVKGRLGKRLEVEITLPPADKVIRGRVVDARGYGVGQVAITARAVTRGLSHVLTTETADDGTFELTDAGTGAYHVTAEIGGRVRAQILSASHYEGLKLVIGGAGGPGPSADNLGYVTPEMLASAVDTPLPQDIPQSGYDNLGVTEIDLSGEVGDQDPGIIAITETEERGDDVMTPYGLADDLPVTGPPRGRGGLPVVFGGGKGKVVVKSVAPGSRVSQAGLAAGDRVLSVDGVKIHTPAEARNAVAGPIGSVVMIEVLHKGERVNIVVQRVRVLGN